MSSTYIGVDSSALVRRKLGANHRTSRTGVVARLIELCGHLAAVLSKLAKRGHLRRIMSLMRGE